MSSDITSHTESAWAFLAVGSFNWNNLKTILTECRIAYESQKTFPWTFLVESPHFLCSSDSSFQAMLQFQRSAFPLRFTSRVSYLIIMGSSMNTSFLIYLMTVLMHTRNNKIEKWAGVRGMGTSGKQWIKPPGNGNTSRLLDKLSPPSPKPLQELSCHWSGQRYVIQQTIFRPLDLVWCKQIRWRR